MGFQGPFDRAMTAPAFMVGGGGERVLGIEWPLAVPASVAAGRPSR